MLMLSKNPNGATVANGFMQQQWSWFRGVYTAFYMS